MAKTNSMKSFRYLGELCDSVLYYRRINKNLYHIIEVENMKDILGEEGTDAKYYATLYVLDFNTIPEEQWDTAVILGEIDAIFVDYKKAFLKLKGEEFEEFLRQVYLAGFARDIKTWKGNNRRELLEEVKYYSLSILEDAEKAS